MTPLTYATQFESFKLGKAPPAGSSSQFKRHSHSRSHSRNVSISISPSPSLPFSLPSHDVSLSSSSCSISSLSQLSSAPATAAKRGSHHRRCSSLSTRRDSAEVMGVSLPALSTSSSEDNINLGDKDSIRRRALWALEGKPSPDGFSPVEIPELGTPEIERRISELRMDIFLCFPCFYFTHYSTQQASPRFLPLWAALVQA